MPSNDLRTGAAYATSSFLRESLAWLYYVRGDDHAVPIPRRRHCGRLVAGRLQRAGAGISFGASGRRPHPPRPPPDRRSSHVLRGRVGFGSRQNSDWVPDSRRRRQAPPPSAPTDRHAGLRRHRRDRSRPGSDPERHLERRARNLSGRRPSASSRRHVPGRRAAAGADRRVRRRRGNALPPRPGDHHSRRPRRGGRRLRSRPPRSPWPRDRHQSNGSDICGWCHRERSDAAPRWPLRRRLLPSGNSLGGPPIGAGRRGQGRLAFPNSRRRISRSDSRTSRAAPTFAELVVASRVPRAASMVPAVFASIARPFGVSPSVKRRAS